VAGASLLALLDDIAVLLDDVSVMTKVAAKKTAGVLGDDLAVNAEKVTGVAADRELPVVWAVFLGSLANKAILVPAALLIAAFVPWLVSPLLMAGGLYLCFEGGEKVWHALSRSGEEKAAEAASLRARVESPDFDPLSYEKRKITGAIRTDFILSAEIIVITLGIVGEAPLLVRASVLTGIALVMTVGVYGLVALIVKLDDAGLYLVQREDGGAFRALQRLLGRLFLALAPRLMTLLSVLGTAAMFLVGGGILVHGLAPLEELGHRLSEMAIDALPLDTLTGVLVPQLYAAMLGMLAGFVVLILLEGGRVIRARVSPSRSD
jgi:predicted DNA repair protein MutK